MNVLQSALYDFNCSKLNGFARFCQSRLIDRNLPADFLVYRPEEFEKRLAMGDPFLEMIVAEGKVLYG
jgi:hypothetical protein